MPKITLFVLIIQLGWEAQLNY